MLIAVRDRGPIPETVYGKAQSDGVLLERLGAESLWMKLKEIWPPERAHLSIGELREWFASYVYLPRLRDRVVLDLSIREAVSQLTPKFGFAASFNEAKGVYQGLIFAKAPPDPLPPEGLLVLEQAAIAQIAAQEAQQRKDHAASSASHEGVQESGLKLRLAPTASPIAAPAPSPAQPTRFFGTVELDVSRPIRSLEAILSAVVAELQRTSGANVKLVLEIQAFAEDGFEEADVGVVRDNAKQLKFIPESTGFEE